MPKNVVSLSFVTGSLPYVTDQGSDLSLNTRFVAPPDIDDIAVAAIAAAVGGVSANEPLICSDTNMCSPRKLQFIRKSGNTMSVAVARRANLNAAAVTIKGILDQAGGANNEVVCIKLIGEECRNLNDELGVSYDGTTFAPTHQAPASALKQNYVTGVMSYSADAAQTFADGTTTSIRSITEKASNDFAAQLGAAAAECIGDLLEIAGCGNGRRNPRKHRRYNLTFAINADTSGTDPIVATETIELPVKSAGQAAIKTCGETAAALPGLYCIGYQGESHSRYHTFLA